MEDKYIKKIYHIFNLKLIKVTKKNKARRRKRLIEVSWSPPSEGKEVRAPHRKAAGEKRAV